MSALKSDPHQILLMAIGNTGRSDDGIGWCFADRLAAMDFKSIKIEYRYQLQVEDALTIADFPLVIFVDASVEPFQDGFDWKPCLPATHYFYSSHMQNPETILYLAETLYNQRPESFTLAIEGQDWELGTSLTEQAERNLDKALKFFENFLEKEINQMVI